MSFKIPSDGLEWSRRSDERQHSHDDDDAGSFATEHSPEEFPDVQGDAAIMVDPAKETMLKEERSEMTSIAPPFVKELQEHTDGEHESYAEEPPVEEEFPNAQDDGLTVDMMSTLTVDKMRSTKGARPTRRSRETRCTTVGHNLKASLRHAPATDDKKNRSLTNTTTVTRKHDGKALQHAPAVDQQQESVFPQEPGAYDIRDEEFGDTSHLSNHDLLEGGSSSRNSETRRSLNWLRQSLELIKAVAVTDEPTVNIDREELRREIIADAVRADVVVASYNRRTRACYFGLLLVSLIALTVGLAVGLTRANSALQKEEHGRSNICETSGLSNVALQCQCFNEITNVSTGTIENYRNVHSVIYNNDSLVESATSLTSTTETQMFSCDRPDNLALWWVAEDANSMSAEVLDLEEYRIMQRHTLATLYLATSGQEWVDNEKWLSTSSECEWLGVTCNATGHVIRLSLNEQNMNGTIPDQIMGLSSLITMNLNDNHLKGTLPDTWFKYLPLVQELDMSNNQLRGQIPEAVNFTELAALAFAYVIANPGTTIEDVVADPRLIGHRLNTKRLRFSNNMFTGSIPAGFLYLGSLEELRLDNNQIQGRINDAAFPELDNTLTDRHARNLEIIDVHNNQISGTLPAFVFSLSNLEYVDVGNNLYTGSIPTDFGVWEDIKHIDFSNNRLTGTIPTEILQLSELQYINFSGNSFTGTFPDVCTNLFLLESPSIDCNSTLRENCPCCRCPGKS